MALIPKLKNTIGRNYGVEADDTLTMKNVLKRLGHYKTPDYGMTPYPDEPMFAGIRGFQKAKGLLVDGVVEPQGPTARALGEALQPTVPRRTMLAAKAAAAGRPVGGTIFDSLLGQAPSPKERPDTRSTGSAQRAQAGSGAEAQSLPFEMFSPVENPTIRNDDEGRGKFGTDRTKTVRDPDGKVRKIEYKHQGVDLIARSGSMIRSPVEGTVERIGDPYGDGKYDIIWIKAKGGHKVGLFYVSPRDANGRQTVKPGDQIKHGQVIGTMQDIAKRVSEMKNHLHLKVMKNGKAINPMPWLKKWGTK